MNIRNYVVNQLICILWILGKLCWIEPFSSTDCRMISLTLLYCLLYTVCSYINHYFTSDINSNPTQFKSEDWDRRTTPATSMHQNISFYNIFGPVLACFTYTIRNIFKNYSCQHLRYEIAIQTSIIVNIYKALKYKSIMCKMLFISCTIWRVEEKTQDATHNITYNTDICSVYCFLMHATHTTKIW